MDISLASKLDRLAGIKGYKVAPKPFEDAVSLHEPVSSSVNVRPVRRQEVRATEVVRHFSYP